MEPDAKIYSHAPGQALGIQLKRGRKEYMNKEGHNHGREIYRHNWTKIMETHEH